MKQIDLGDPAFKKLLAEISPEILATLTDEQIEAIYKVFSYRAEANHSIDLRISIPIPGARSYLLFLAGWERRSQTRLIQEKGLYPILTPINFLFLMGFLTITFFSIFTIFSFLLPSISIPSIFIHSTSIPWIDNQSECEKTGRTWDNKKCWDDQHSPDF